MIIIPQNSTPTIAQLTAMPEILRLGGAINSEVIRGSDSMETKTKGEPVSTTPVEGVLLFYAPIKLEILKAPATRLEITAKDLYGKETKVTKIMGEWLHR